MTNSTVGKGRARILASSALFAAMTALGGLIAVPFYPVPLTLQTFFVYLSVIFLGKWAFLSQLIYLALGLAGLPIFGGGVSGYVVFLGPTGGYLLGFVVGALIAGNLLQRVERLHYAKLVALLLCAMVIFAMGWLWLARWLQVDLLAAFLVGVLPFLPGDIIKITLALVVGRRVSRSKSGMPMN